MIIVAMLVFSSVFMFSFMFIESSKAADEDIEWSIQLNIKPDEGANDTLIFGEVSDASNDKDEYDVPKPPAPQSPHIRAWFNTNLDPPYNLLWEEYRKYPDNYNVWNFTIMWTPENDLSTSVNIYWDISQVSNTEYSSTHLYKNNSNVADMMTDDSYTYLHSANTPYTFQIISQSEENPPNNPNPFDGKTDVDVNTDLSWTGGDPDGDPVTYDVYFGTTSPPSKVSSNQSSTSYDPGTMDYDKTYYWKVVAWDDKDTLSEGAEWDFTTEENPSNVIGKETNFLLPIIIIIIIAIVIALLWWRKK